MTAVLDDAGQIAAWQQQMVGPSVSKSVIGRMNPMFAGDYPPDLTNAEGAMHLPYALPNFRCDHAQVNLPVATGYWRSVGNSYNAFFVETFIDELAVALKKDPYLFRLELLGTSRVSSRCSAPPPALRSGTRHCRAELGPASRSPNRSRASSARWWTLKWSARTSRCAASSARWIAAPRCTPRT